MFSGRDRGDTSKAAMPEARDRGNTMEGRGQVRLSHIDGDWVSCEQGAEDGHGEESV